VSHKIRNGIAVALILASFALLIPGVTRPALTIEATANLPLLGKLNLLHETRSILGTVKNLRESGNHLVAGLIFAFSILVPTVKGLLLLYVVGFKRAPARMFLFRTVQLIGKWSMADVFVMGIFLAFLAGNAVTGMTAVLHEGFWYFLGYCLLSVLSAQFMRVEPAPATAA
jgi:paraquat-inducible protein A